MIQFHDPRGKVAIEATPYALGIDLEGANRCTVGFLANGFPDSEPFLAALADAMKVRLPALDARHWNKGNASIPAPAAMLEEIERDCVALIAAWGH